MILINAEANFKICIIENKNPSKISKKISFVSHDYDKRVCVDSPRSWSPFQTFVQRALRSGIIFLTRRHRKLGRTRVVDTVHSSLSLFSPPLSSLCVPAGFGISNRNRNRSVSKFANYVRPPFTHARPFHKTRADISRVPPSQSWIPQFLEVNARSCLYFVLGSEAIRDRVGFERARDKIRWSSPSLSGK